MQRFLDAAGGSQRGGDSWMVVFFNNAKVVAVHCVLGIFSMIGLIVLMYNAESIRVTGLSIALCILIIGVNISANYFSGRFFLKSSSNLLLDSLSFILIIALSVVYVFNLDEPLLLVVFSSKFLVEGLIEAFMGVNYERLSVFITVFLSILIQFLGVIKAVRSQSKTSTTVQGKRT